jgi:hypothetical protein
MQEELNTLKQRVADLENWKRQRETQQLAFPLDNESVEILMRYFMRITSAVSLTYGGAAGRFFTKYFGQQDQYQFEIDAVYDSLYTVDPSTDILTVITGQTRFFDTDQVTLGTSDTMPTPLVAGTTYYVRDSTETTFKLALTSGGVAINITDEGAGLQIITKA